MLYKRSSRNRCQKKSLLKLVQRLEFLPLEFTGILGIQSVVQQIFTESLYHVPGTFLSTGHTAVNRLKGDYLRSWY